MVSDNRFKQRLDNLEKSLSNLEKGLEIEKPDIFQKAGIIQFFELSFELAWKTLKDYLENNGFPEIITPRDIIKKSFEIGLISDGHLWLKALENRNLTSHTYDEEMAEAAVKEIKSNYFSLLLDVKNKLGAK